MARKPLVVPTAPSLTAEKAIPILEGLIRESDRVRYTHRDSAERGEWIHTAEGALRAAFGSNDAIVQAFGSAQCGTYSSYDTEQDLNEQAEAQLSGMVSVLQSAAKQLRWRLPDPDQIFLPAGSQHDAFMEIRKIIQQTRGELFIVDPWVDHTLWPLLTNVPSSCQVRVLTENMKGDFCLEARKFVAQHATQLSIRRTASYHDRFIILDRTRCFHLGASIKDAGNKAFALSELQRSTIAQAVINDVEAEWMNAIPVTV